MLRSELVTIVCVSSCLALARGAAATEDDDQGGGVRVSSGGPGTFALPGLVINEVSPGPYFSYVEVYNARNVPLDLTGYAIETATGTFLLDGLGYSLASGGYFVLTQGTQDQVGISDNSDVPCIVVSEPVCGHVSDTVILRGPDGTVQDAISYGVTVDTSARYAEASAAGQFADSTFVAVSDQYEELVIGRDRTGTDTNDVADWDVLGGANALVGSPFGPNTALPHGEDVWVPFFQGFLSDVIAQEYFDLTVVGGAYSNYAEAGPTSSCDHVMVFRGDLLGAGDWAMTGTVQNEVELLGGGRYAVSSTGVLSGLSSRSIAFSARRELGGAQSLTSLSATLVVEEAEYPYEMTMSRSFTGTRGSFGVSLTRELTGWSGLTRATTGSQDVGWILSPDGTVQSTVSTAQFSRPWPLTDGPFGSPIEPTITTETVTLECTSTGTATGVSQEWAKYEISYANDIPTITGQGFVMDVSVSPGGDAIAGSLVGTMTAPGGVAESFASTVTIAAVPGDKLVRWTKQASILGQAVEDFDATYDPPIIATDWWDKLRKTVRVGAKAIGSTVSVGLGAVGCAATTAGATALGGVSSVASLGTATLPAVALGVGGVTACAGLASGGWELAKEVWAQ